MSSYIQREAFLPIYFDPGYGFLLPTVDAIELPQSRFIIPTHFNDINHETFMSEYSILVENPNSENLNFAYYTSRVFKIC
jgi:hypothetical protein